MGYSPMHIRTYIARVQDRCIFLADLGKHVALVAQQPMHIPNEAQIVLVSRCLADRLPPFFYQLEDSTLYARRMHRRTLWESTDELVQEFLCAYLQMESVTAVFDADIEELCVGEPCVE
jgi:hypothetical protein